MRHGHRAFAGALLLGSALLTGCACMYGACGGRGHYLEWDGERCTPIESARRNWFELSSSGKVHRFSTTSAFYARCFEYKGRSGTTLTVAVESDAFEPEIMLFRRGDESRALAHDQGTNVARFSVTLEKGGDYVVIVTSVGPEERGRFDMSYEEER